MKDSVSSLTDHVDINVLSGYPLIVYLLVGVVFTAIIQSSSAAMMLTLSALYAGIIPLPAAAALVIGADLGTTSTVLLGSLQGAVSKRRLAIAHVLFNLSVDTLAFILLLPLLALIKALHIDDPLFALVSFHSVFNLLGILLFLPFIGKFASFLEKKIKEKQSHIDIYIHNVPEDITDAALEALNRETRHLLSRVIHLNLRFLNINADKFKQIDMARELPKAPTASKLDHYLEIKNLEGEIINYAYKIQSVDGGEHQKAKEEIVLRIDNLIKSIRSAVYSAKSLKDIMDNIESFRVRDNHTVTKNLHELTRWAESIYPAILDLLNASDDREIILGELSSLEKKSKDYHRKFEHKLYNKINEVEFSSLDLSTLLNVNKEMQTSEKALIQALGWCY